MTLMEKIVILVSVTALFVVGGYFWAMFVMVPEALKPRLIWSSPGFQLTVEKHSFEINRSVMGDIGILVQTAPTSSGEVSGRFKEPEYLVELYLDDSVTSEILFNSNSVISRMFSVKKENNIISQGWRVHNNPGELRELTLTTSGPVHLSSATLEIYKLP